MFYNHEVLTSRKYGIATVWLVATLGSKSHTKKVTRKAILNVDVQKACNTVMEPDAPMALRLQSNLLFGISRVYDQQCGYVLADAQIAQTALRALMRATKDSGIDANAGRANRDQLVLEDDPAFMPEMSLPTLDLEFSSLQADLKDFRFESQNSLMSPHSRRRSGSSVSSNSLLLDIQSSGIGSYRLPQNDPFQVSSSHKPSLGLRFGDEEQLMVDDDLDFDFDAEGNIRERDETEMELMRAGSIVPQYGRSESIFAVGRPHLEGEEATSGVPQPHRDADEDFIMQFDDDANHLPDAPSLSPKPHVREQRRLSKSSFDEGSSSETVAAKMKAPRKRHEAKPIKVDERLEFRNSDLARWNKEYAQNMQNARDQKEKKAAVTQAKINAKIWLFGNGIGNIGQGNRYPHIPNPLDMFAGDELMAAITGVVPERRSKRSRVDEGAEEPSRHVRSRLDINIDEENVGRGGDDELPPLDDDYVLQFGDESNPEVGRDAPAPLEDHPSSAMPWNVSASIRSFRAQAGPAGGSIHALSSLGRGRGSSAAGHGGRLGSRLTSTSPLFGRGSAVAGIVPDIEYLHDGGDEFDFPAGGGTGGYSSSIRPAVGGRGRSLSPSVTGEQQQLEFEKYGPAATVDTQTAESSQWAKEALAREAMHFFDFVKNSIGEQDEDSYGDDDIVEDIDDLDSNGEPTNKSKGEITFENMFPEEQSTAVVAAQAFHHLLTLATKRLVKLTQEGGKDGFGEITIRVV